MNRREFDGVPFAAGSMIGLRAFSTAEDHITLTGLTYRSQFLPGVNQAAHLNIYDQRVLTEDLPETHEVAMLRCQCGFWAYFNGRNNSSHPQTVAAIVEGFGRVTYGTEGFRAAAMRILGIIREPFHEGDASNDCGCPACNRGVVTLRMLVEISRRYGVPLYPTHADAIESHPLSTPPPPVPRA